MVAAVNTPMVVVGLTALLVLGISFMILGINKIKVYQRVMGSILISFGILSIATMVVLLVLLLIK